MADLVVDLRDRRPVWAVPPWAVDAIRSAIPAEWSLFEATTWCDGAGDGGGLGPSPEVLDNVKGASVYLGYGVAPQLLQAGRETLRWVHSGSAGVGGSLHPAMREAVGSGRVTFTNSAGIHGPPMAETVVAMVLHFVRGLDLALAGREERAWVSSRFFEAGTPVTELSRLTVGILGYGGIGREVARRMRGLGVERVLGLRRREVEGDAGCGGAGGGAAGPRDELGTELLAGFGEEGLGRLLEASDVLVVAAPETPETRGILDRERIGRMKRGAVLVNVARGSLVVEEALEEALRSGHLRGAGLDVFATEPLPPESPLWSLPNLLPTPHVSAVSRAFWEREVELIVENLARFRAGRPLLNQVDVAAGY
jgi:phosphoglycerate dehydrogenase-like enzyme